MNDERLIQILVAQQWEKCKGELHALVALHGAKKSEYIENVPVQDREWRKLLSIINEFTEHVEAEGLNE